MHGAIVADAVRVPWVPVRLYEQVLDFKWRDWCQAVALDYAPTIIPALYSTPAVLQKWVRSLPPDQREWANSALFGAGPLSRCARRALVAIIEPWRRRAFGRDFQLVVNALGETAHAARPMLSTDATIELVTARLLDRLEQLIADLRAGRLAPGRALQPARLVTV
jgi:succinoglycan biosynthesis protein ExoV